jgi:hypothetical protein
VPRKAISFRLPEELLEAVDEARGDVSRTRFVERALEKALPTKAGAGEDARVSPAGPVAPPRASGQRTSGGAERMAREVLDDSPPIPKIAKRHWSG